MTTRFGSSMVIACTVARARLQPAVIGSPSDHGGARPPLTVARGNAHRWDRCPPDPPTSTCLATAPQVPPTAGDLLRPRDSGPGDLRGCVDVDLRWRLEEALVDQFGVLLHWLEVLVDVAFRVLIEPLTELHERLLMTFALHQDVA